MLFPLYSILRQNEGGFARPAAQVVMLHLKRVHLMEWVRAVMAVALGAPPGASLPPLIMQREQDDLWSQPSTPLPCLAAPHRSSEVVLMSRAVARINQHLDFCLGTFLHSQADEPWYPDGILRLRSCLA